MCLLCIHLNEKDESGAQRQRRPPADGYPRTYPHDLICQTKKTRVSFYFVAHSCVSVVFFFNCGCGHTEKERERESDKSLVGAKLIKPLPPYWGSIRAFPLALRGGKPGRRRRGPAQLGGRPSDKSFRLFCMPSKKYVQSASLVLKKKKKATKGLTLIFA